MTQQEWDRLLDASPHDLDLRTAYAVWLQDDAEDMVRADFQRWLVSARKWPTNAPLDREEQGWAWYWQDEPTEPRKHATLHRWALEYMPRERWLYPTRRRAEEVLYEAWVHWEGADVSVAPDVVIGGDRTPPDRKRDHFNSRM